MKTTCVVLASALLIAGCGDKPAGTEQLPVAAASQATAPPPPPPKPPYTKSEWRTAFKSMVEESDNKTDSDGITEYIFCYKRNDKGKCPDGFFGKRDSFRKIDILTPMGTQIHKVLNTDDFVGIYLSALECKPPNILIYPAIVRHDSWVFMEKVAFMADGEVVLEKDFDHTDVERETRGSKVFEKATFVSTQENREALRKFASAKQHIIRITGQKGYVTVGKVQTASFVKDAQNSLEVLALLEKSFKDNGGPVCDPAPESSTK